MNLILTSQKGNEARASAEFKEIALQHGIRKLHVEKSDFDGVLEVEMEDPRSFVAFIREYVRSEPFRMHFVQRVIPVDVVVSMLAPSPDRTFSATCRLCSPSIRLTS